MHCTPSSQKGHARAGRRVVPVWGAQNGVCRCRKGEQCPDTGKHPRTRHGHSDATIDVKRIQTWRWNTANIGIATGIQSGLLVIDIDMPEGRNSLVKLEKQLS